MDRDVVRIPFKNKVVQLIFDDIEDEIDLDRLTFVDYMNIKEEYLTVSSLCNRVGLWRAEMEERLDKMNLKIKIREAELSEFYRKDLTREDSYANGKPKTLYPTNGEVENAVTIDKEMQNLRKKGIRYKKEFGTIDSLFWAIKSKSRKVDRLIEAQNVVPEDFEKEIVEGRWNGILIKCREKLIKDVK